MAYLGVGIWIVSAVISYFIGEAIVLCCDRREWDRPHKILIAVESALLGPVALIIFLQALMWMEMAKDAPHRYRLHFKRK
ncbi:hypothetical protein ACFL6U_17855 [Planctomycetota bacterium]